MVDFKFKKSGLFAAGVLFGTAGIKILILIFPNILKL